MTRTSAANLQLRADAEHSPRPLTAEDRMTAFRIATGSFVSWYAVQIEAGLSDQELEAALEISFGIMGGSCGPGALDVTYQGPGLRIWATWEITSHYGTRPIFAGHATVAMAREVCRPDDAPRSRPDAGSAQAATRTRTRAEARGDTRGYSDEVHDDGATRPITRRFRHTLRELASTGSPEVFCR